MQSVTVTQARKYLAEAQTDEARKVWEDHIAAQLKSNGYIIDILEPGDNQNYPKRGDSVKMRYVGKLASTGEVFDANTGDRPFEFKLGAGQVIRGWDEGIARMSLGEHAVLHIHSSYGYGKGGRGKIPSEADLEFEVRLVGINNKSAIVPTNTESAKPAPGLKTSSVSLKRVEIPVATGVKLEGLLRIPEAPKDHAILITHPHPKLGGNMRNNLVSALAEALSLEGYPNLAINFRGIGGSTGSSSWRGWDERQDVIAACNYLGTLYPKVLIAGYSFGAAVACGVADEVSAVTGYVAISYPCGFASKMLLGNHFPYAKTSKPKFFVCGDADSFSSVSVSREFIRGTSKPADLEVVIGGDHFWMGNEIKAVRPIVMWIHKHTGNEGDIREEKQVEPSSFSSSSSSISSSSSSSSSISSSSYTPPSLKADPVEHVQIHMPPPIPEEVKLPAQQAGVHEASLIEPAALPTEEKPVEAVPLQAEPFQAEPEPAQQPQAEPSHPAPSAEALHPQEFSQPTTSSEVEHVTPVSAPDVADKSDAQPSSDGKEVEANPESAPTQEEVATPTDTPTHEAPSEAVPEAAVDSTQPSTELVEE